MKRLCCLTVVLVVLGYFLWREISVANLDVPLLVVEENVVLWRSGSDALWGMGNLDSPRARGVGRSLLPFFSRSGISLVWDIPPGKEHRGEDFLIQRVSDNLSRLVWEDEVVWWIGENFDDREKENVVQMGVDLDGDYWVMINNRLPGFLSVPRRGILFAGSRKPSKKTEAFALEEGIPLVTVAKTKGFILQFEDEWVLATRDYLEN